MLPSIIVSNKATGDLLYDADGPGSGAAVKFAFIQNTAASTASDSLVI